jgi:hypothetical protein
VRPLSLLKRLAEAAGDHRRLPNPFKTFDFWTSL